MSAAAHRVRIAPQTTIVVPQSPQDIELLRRIARSQGWRLRAVRSYGEKAFSRPAYIVESQREADDIAFQLVEIHGWRGWWAQLRPGGGGVDIVQFLEGDIDVQPIQDQGAIFQRSPNPKGKQVGLFGDQQAQVEGFALVSPKGEGGRASEGKGTQEGLPGVSRQVSVEALTKMREKELAQRAARKRRLKRNEREGNPERWLAPKLQPAERARLKQLHDVYFDTFEEIEAFPGATLTTRTGKYVAPEGYALMFREGGVDYLFFQDDEPAQTWTFVTVGRTQDRVEHLPHYLAVLERVDTLSRQSTRRHNRS